MDGELREPIMTIAVGMKGIGKTYTTKKIMEQYARGNPSKGIKPRRVLIFDVNNEFTDYKTIPLNYIQAFSYSPKIEIRRIPPFKPNGQDMTLDEMQVALDYILSNFSNGLLYIEDINRYVTDSLNRDIVGRIVTNRHRNLDVYLSQQSLGKAGHPKLIANTTYLRLHETTDTFERHKNKYGEYLEVGKIAECTLKVLNNRLPSDKRRAYLYINLQLRRIFGEFTKDDFKKGCEDYITQNPTSTIRNLMNEKGIDGKKRYTSESAFNYLIQKYIETYYGNN